MINAWITWIDFTCCLKYDHLGSGWIWLGKELNNLSTAVIKVSDSHLSILPFLQGDWCAIHDSIPHTLVNYMKLIRLKEDNWSRLSNWLLEYRYLKPHLKSDATKVPNPQMEVGIPTFHGLLFQCWPAGWWGTSYSKQWHCAVIITSGISCSETVLLGWILWF